ncbi:hypothetical protein D0437_16240 [Bacillus cereus]|uniref:Uncharacterized protein n=1 Tax=Bacillus cereus TaxID=1396 RepID=A0A9X7LWX3_BACCE|nr:hypothetical protein D0437_16240 [Bacillus cereus]
MNKGDEILRMLMEIKLDMKELHEKVDKMEIKLDLLKKQNIKNEATIKKKQKQLTRAEVKRDMSIF